jgi:hypothetical protein
MAEPDEFIEVVSRSIQVEVDRIRSGVPNDKLPLTFGWTTLFMGDMGEGALREEERK